MRAPPNKIFTGERNKESGILHITAELFALRSTTRKKRRRGSNLTKSLLPSANLSDFSLPPPPNISIIVRSDAAAFRASADILSLSSPSLHFSIKEEGLIIQSPSDLIKLSRARKEKFVCLPNKRGESRLISQGARSRKTFEYSKTCSTTLLRTRQIFSKLFFSCGGGALEKFFEFATRKMLTLTF